MTLRVGVAAALLLYLAGPALAVDIVTVPVGDPGNADDTEGDGYGGVDQVYWIGMYEVTNEQYCAFLTAVASAEDTYGLYNELMTSDPFDDEGGISRTGTPGHYSYSPKAGRANNAVNYVSWYDALRFCNWLHNGQPEGLQDSTTTEDGAYTFSGATSVGPRNLDALSFLPTEDEWYKAAYYKGGTEGGYWDYATQSDIIPVAEPPPGGSNSANYDEVVGGHHVTDVGAYSLSISAYGTFDQTGNMWEWTETADGGDRVLRGGSWHSVPSYISASYRGNRPPPTMEQYHIGFRVATIPEPGTLFILAIGGLGLLRRRRG